MVPVRRSCSPARITGTTSRITATACAEVKILQRFSTMMAIWISSSGTNTTFFDSGGGRHPGGPTIHPTERSSFVSPTHGSDQVQGSPLTANRNSTWKRSTRPTSTACVTEVAKARDRGIYVSVMLFEGWAFQFTNAWNDHPFRVPNNVNGIDADPHGRGLLYNQLKDDEMGKKVLALQETYVRKVIDTVNDLDNVLYEVCNEAGAYSTRWQYYLIDFIQKYEESQPKKHPVGMTFMYRDGTNKMLIDSPADWISPNPGSPDESYKDRPSARYVGKVVVNDTDHLWGHTGGDSVWVWRSFLRRTERPVHGGAEPEPDLAGFGSDRHGAVGLIRSQDRPGPHDPRAPNCPVRDTCSPRQVREYLAYQDGSQGEFFDRTQEY